MTSRTEVIRAVFQLMERQGKLSPGDRLPSTTQMIERMRINQTPYDLALWGLIVSGEVDQVGHKLFWGQAPPHIRTIQQIRLITLTAIAQGFYSEGSTLTPGSDIAEAFGSSKTQVHRALAPLREMNILDGVSRGGLRIVRDGRKRAKQETTRFQFDLSTRDTQVDRFLEAMEQSSDHKTAENTRVDGTTSISTLRHSLVKPLLLRFGVAVEVSERLVKIQEDLSVTERNIRIAQCRAWLRRRHRINPEDVHLLVAASK